jgi:transposase-like protein
VQRPKKVLTAGEKQKKIVADCLRAVDKIVTECKAKCELIAVLSMRNVSATFKGLGRFRTRVLRRFLPGSRKNTFGPADVF